ncbi:hypothetical protein BVL52_10155 [Pseudomonas oryzihabitans]|uniref:Smf/DprA SLOG domain-containing protein n=1 Tax=Pseudomonas oryzihabitans TaxID=47885 RepID=A0ABX3IT20_9PSED|nr:hypothetical protein BVL52_10155 [Pseudomonas psychrotolerans]
MDSIERDLDACEKLGVKVFSSFDSEYPDTFRKIPDAPPIIYCKGEYRLLKEKCLTVIGTREPTLVGVESAKRITAWFAENGWVIVSGLAVGVDATAHKQCLDSRGKTIAVLAHGLEKIYPAENKHLAASIMDQGGLLMSEYAPYSKVFKSGFVERDRLQAALSMGTVLVQTGVQGGSLHASRASLFYNRILIVVNPVAADIDAQQEKIEGNLKIINTANKSELSSYLKCSAFMLENIRTLKGRGDYESLNFELNKSYNNFS